VFIGREPKIEVRGVFRGRMPESVREATFMRRVRSSQQVSDTSINPELKESFMSNSNPRKPLYVCFVKINEKIDGPTLVAREQHGDWKFHNVRCCRTSRKTIQRSAAFFFSLKKGSSGQVFSVAEQRPYPSANVERRTLSRILKGHFGGKKPVSRFLEYNSSRIEW